MTHPVLTNINFGGGMIVLLGIDLWSLVSRNQRVSEPYSAGIEPLVSNPYKHMDGTEEY